MRTVPILLYHSVSDDPLPSVERWSVGTEQFRSHMRMLREEGWTAYTVSHLLSELRHGEQLPERAIAVTFDDGFEDTLSAALPLMDGMAGTVYVTSGYLRDRAAAGLSLPGRMLASGQLAELAQGGFEVGVHGHRHVALDEVSRAVAEREIVDSKHLVEDALGAGTSSFAYPYGYHDAAVQELVRRSGFWNAVGVKNVYSHDADDLWGIARITIERGTGRRRLAQLLADPLPPIAPERDRLLTVGWRAARRARSALAKSHA